jgi:hypothetical protein
MTKTNSPQFPEWLRLLIFTVAGLVIALGLFSLYTAATRWTSLPDNPIVILYFFIMLIVLPLLAVWAFVLTWQERNPRLAAVLAAIPATLLLLRALLIGGV